MDEICIVCGPAANKARLPPAYVVVGTPRRTIARQSFCLGTVLTQCSMDSSNTDDNVQKRQIKKITRRLEI
ncbi:hypothetical protein K0M31_000242 [Melipona bicolor]|uniref:Uncharacterized protein n=1 Tax=Melipona bicolor TaxID=60889 RepID=A0AA40GEF3_9HYME|nr:hypothetical protein K0M31_000242 [Melipona bicolor]